MLAAARAFARAPTRSYLGKMQRLVAASAQGERFAASRLAGFTVESMDDKFAEDAAQLVSRVMADHSVLVPPPDIRNLITSSLSLSFYQTLCNEPVNQKLSVVAIDEATGKLVGAAVSEPHSLEDPDLPLDQLPEEYRQYIVNIRAMMGDLHRQYFGTEGAFAASETMHLFFLAVDPSAWNRGIGKTLVREAIDRARENGYKAVVAEYIAPTSAHVGVCRATAIE